MSALNHDLLEEQDPNEVLNLARESNGPRDENRKGLSTFEAALGLLSTIVGGGIVGIPYAMYHCGIPMGLLLNILLAFSTQYSVTLYLAAKEQIPVRVESLYEIGFVSMGRSSIFLISIIQLISSLGLMLIYFIIFGDTFSSVIWQLCFPDSEEGNFLTTRVCYDLILGLMLSPLILKKELAELKLISITLFLALGIFVVIFVI